MGVFDESNVPHEVQIAGSASAFSLAEFGNVNIVPAVRFADCMQGLMDVGNKVHKKFQGSCSF